MALNGSFSAACWASQRHYDEYEMTKLTRPTADLKVRRHDLALRGFKTTLTCIAGSSNAYYHFQANLLRCNGHGGDLLCWDADAAWSLRPAASHGLQGTERALQQLWPAVGTLRARNKVPARDREVGYIAQPHSVVNA
jgi:hypothetical protein